MYENGIGYEQLKEGVNLTYELRVFADGEEIFASEYEDDVSMQEDLHKVDKAIAKHKEEVVEL